jgi:O-antigen/teichoic acid export membrane protein
VFIQKLKNSLLVRNTLWLIVGQGMRVVIQAIYFILMARALGVSGYGAFAGVGAWVAVASPFASLGYGNILIKHVARDRSMFNLWWGKGLIMTMVSGLVLMIAAITLSKWVLPDSIPLLLVIMVAVADLIFTRLLDLSAQAFQAFEQLNRTAQLQVLINFARLLAVLILWLFTPSVSVLTWGECYLVSTVIAALIALWMVTRTLGKPVISMKNITKDITEGFYFSVSLSAQNVYNDIDKTMLSRFSTLSATGIYGAAYRFIDIAFLPVRSLLWASNVRFFQHGAHSLRAGIGYARSLLPWALTYSFAVGAFLYLAAPLIPVILGAGYQDSVIATRWLAMIPILRVMHYFAADALTGANYQGLRSGIQVIVAGFNVAINFWLIPLYSWLGAAWSSCVTDGLLAVLMWIVVSWLLRKRSGRLPDIVPGEEVSLNE